jgi:putative membrane protein
MNNNYGWSMDMGWGFPFMGFFFLIFFIIGITYVIKFVFTGGEEKITTDQQQEDNPMDILKQRYARGEIDQQTFDDMKRNLRKI